MTVRSLAWDSASSVNGVMPQVVEAQASGRALDLAYISTAFGVAADSRGIL